MRNGREAEKFQYPGFDHVDMDRSRVLSLGFVVIVIVGLGTPAVAPTGAQSGFALQQNVDPDLVNLNVQVQANGDATWEIEYFVRLGTENETQAFEDLIADVEQNRSAYLSRFADRMNSTVASATESTGREMSTSDFAVDAEIRTLGNQYGVLTYRFHWQNFAQVSGEELLVGDALEGFFLDQETTLQFSWPEDYTVSSVGPEPTSTREGTVVWSGPIDFSTGEPSLTLTPVSAVTTTTDDGTTATSPTPTTPSEEGSSIWIWVIGGIVLLALLAAAFWYFQTRTDSDTAPPVEGGGEPPAEPPDELLSNEERVEQFLESQGGRAKQQEIVDGLEWTEAKTSQVLTDMQSSGRIEKFRIGRENVVKLPDSDDEDE